MSKVKSYIKLVRPKHWAKNLFLFLPLFFGGELLNTTAVLNTFIGFIVFSLVASSVYIINDYRDVEKDKLHPRKKFRPLASGKVGKPQALILFFILLFVGLSSSFYLGVYFSAIIGIYLINNLIYSFGGKNIPVFDMLSVAFGFLLRVEAGGATAAVENSNWLYLMTLLLALFLVSGKRRDDFMVSDNSAQLRKVSGHYNVKFLDAIITMTSAVVIVSYVMYTFKGFENHSDVQKKLGMLSIVLVIAGMLKYLQVIFVKNKSGSPTKILFKDHFLQLIILFWVITNALIIYLEN